MLRKLRRRQKKWFTYMKKRVYVHQCLSTLVCVCVCGGGPGGGGEMSRAKTFNGH